MSRRGSAGCCKGGAHRGGERRGRERRGERRATRGAVEYRSNKSLTPPLTASSATSYLSTIATVAGRASGGLRLASPLCLLERSAAWARRMTSGRVLSSALSPASASRHSPQRAPIFATLPYLRHSPQRALVHPRSTRNTATNLKKPEQGHAFCKWTCDLGHSPHER